MLKFQIEQRDPSLAQLSLRDSHCSDQQGPANTDFPVDFVKRLSENGMRMMM
jgi:hypothetical protein